MNRHSPPLLHAVEPLLIDVPVAWRTSVRCSIDRHGITWDGTQMAFERMRSVAYASRNHQVNLVQSQLSRRILLESTEQRLDIQLGHKPFGPSFDAAHRAAYDTIVAAVHEAAEPRLRAEALRRIAAGDLFRVGPLTLSHAGLSHRDHHCIRPVAWEHMPVALLEGSQVVLHGTRAGRPSQPWMLDMLTPNAVLLPELLAEATQAFT